MRVEGTILAVARQSARKVAVETDGGVVTYGDLDSASARWAHQIRCTGLSDEDPVWLCMGNSPEFVIAVFAILRAGCAVVLVNPRLGEHDLRQLSAVCPPAGVFCGTADLQRMSCVLGYQHPCLMPAGTWQFPLETRPGARHPTVQTLPTDQGLPAVVFCTSGSTGVPKAVLLTHDSITFGYRAAAEVFGLQPCDRTLICMQMCHAFTFTKQMLAHLAVGATLLLGPEVFSAASILETAEKRAATTLFAVPSMHVMMYDYVTRSRLPLQSLRLLVSGGAPMPHAVQIGLSRELPHVGFVSSYGLSEASPFVSALPPKWSIEKVGSIGQAIPGIQVMISDDVGQAVPSGTVGELCVRGPNIMACYLNNPAATRTALRGGWLHTGDLGWQDQDGCIYLVGRRDDLIIRGGENVYPQEIECILQEHPAVQEALVVGTPHPVLGQDLLAYIVVRSGMQVAPHVLRAHCMQHLASFKVPREISIVPGLPQTANGKIKRARPEPAAVRAATTAGSPGGTHQGEVGLAARD